MCQASDSIDIEHSNMSFIHHAALAHTDQDRHGAGAGKATLLGQEVFRLNKRLAPVRQ